MFLSVIVPCFNEEAVILEAYLQLEKVLSEAFDAEDYEFIFINDGSQDRTLEILKKQAKEDHRIKIINLSRNFGHQIAVTAGLNSCASEFAVIIDADLQDPPEVILEMLSIQQKTQANVVYGVRLSREGESWFKKKTASAFYRLLNYLADVEFPVDTGDFRLVDRKVINVFNSLKEKNKYIRGLISWMGFKQVPVYYHRNKRFAGETKYPLRKMLSFAMLALIYFSKKPLLISTILGLLVTFTGLLFASWLIIGRFFDQTNVVTGWTSLIVAVVFLGGIQLLTIGVLGQYIGILFDEAKDRPEYIIDEKINFNERNAS